ncbi:MAG: phenylalanine--tRNA ligase subunit beta [Candidatus Omnitrophota bacterium]
MKFTYSWLKRYIDIKLTPKEIADILTMAGLEVVSVEKIGGDFIFEIEVTTNRPDWLNITGVARELAALGKGKFKPPAVTIKKESVMSYRGGFSVTIADKKACPRYTARIILDVKVGPSPEWLKESLESIGLRPVNNIVDITNFCLFELGQPLHAFDLDKLTGNSIIVRKAAQGESIVTIDGVERSLEEDILVIADNEKPAAIAGILGGKDTEVTDSTKNILLESAYFEPTSIRRTARKLALSSDSSYRFERDVSFDMVRPSSDRASSLIAEIAKGKVVRRFFDVGTAPKKSTFLTLRPERVRKVLGVDIPKAFIENSLTCLGFETSWEKEKFSVKTSGFRKDVTKEIDLIEEIARLYGYDKIPSKIPKGLLTSDVSDDGQDRKKISVIKNLLCSLGFNEVITYSLINPQVLKKLGMESDETIVRIKNPLSAEQAIMRPTLLGNIITAASFNLNRGEPLINIFELGDVYKKQNNAYKQELYLAGALSGVIDKGWSTKQRLVDFFDLKGVLEALFEKLRVREAEFAKEKRHILIDNSSCGIYIREKCVGLLGQVKSEYLKNFDVKEKMFIFEIALGYLLHEMYLSTHFETIAKFPSVKRDISLVVDSEVSSASIIDILKRHSSTLVQEVRLFDRYQGGQIPPGKKSLAYSIEYRAHDRTLTDEEVNSLHGSIVRTLTGTLNAQVREK